jgi:hypothetical protein
MIHEFSIDQRTFVIQIAHDNQWDGASFSGMLHGMLTEINNPDAPKYPIYITHLIGRTVEELVDKAKLYASSYVNGDFYCLMDPETREYTEKQDTTV